MYKKVAWPSLFGEGNYTNYYKDGELIAVKDDGEPIHLMHYRKPSYDTLTRAKGYRYWQKYFPDRYCWTLPEALQEALDMPSATTGYFVDKHGQLCCYEG